MLPAAKRHHTKPNSKQPELKLRLASPSQASTHLLCQRRDRLGRQLLALLGLHDKGERKVGRVVGEHQLAARVVVLVVVVGALAGVAVLEAV